MGTWRWSTSKGVLATLVLAVCPTPAHSAPSSASPQTLAAQKVAEARSLIADSIPEERPQAERLLVEALRLDPRSAEAYAELVAQQIWEVNSGLRAQSELLEALDLAEQVKSLAPERPLGDYLKSELLLILGKNQEAERINNLAIQAFPHHPDTEVFRTRTQAEDTPRLALEAAQRALAQGVSSDQLSATVATAIEKLAMTGSLGSALSGFAKIHPDRWLWHRAGMAYTSEKRFAQARSAFEKAIQLGNTLESRLQLAILAQSHLHDPQLAIHEYKNLLQSMLQNGRARKDIMAGVHARLAFAHLERNEIPEALAAAKKAFREDVENERLIQAVYEAFSRKRLNQELHSALEQVAVENPSLTYAHMSLGELAMARKEFPEAIRHFDKAFALNPDDDAPAAARAHAYYETKEFEFALQDFDRAIRNRPQEATHYYNRACMLSLLGRDGEALSSLRTAILMDQSLAQTAHTDADLEALRREPHLQSQLNSLGILNSEKPDQAATTAAHNSE